MKSTARQLQQPVEVVCREHAIALLGDCSTEVGRLGSAADTEALHDFRVSVRRLRTYLGAYQSYLPKAVAGKARRQLGDLISVTNHGRDDQVQSRWLDSQLARKNLPLLMRKGFTQVAATFESVPFDSETEELVALKAEYTGIEKRLGDRLGEPLRTIKLTEHGDSLRFAGATGQIIRDLTAKLGSRLGAIESLNQAKRIHRTRLTAKRMRYVLEPVRMLVVGGRTVIRQLKGLQDVLGDIRDLQLLEQRVRSSLKQGAADWSRAIVEAATTESTLAAIMRKGGKTDDIRGMAAALFGVRQAETRLFKRLQTQWLGGNSEPFMLQVDKITLQLLPTEALSRKRTEGSREST
ncbi:MAG: CHAD domain-containing protein [Gemmatimonadota bacterium]|nr:MAG: CHAD domain-containing protein [Gemmatimonadota bacterium]